MKRITTSVLKSDRHVERKKPHSQRGSLGGAVASQSPGRAGRRRKEKRKKEEKIKKKRTASYVAG